MSVRKWWDEFPYRRRGRGPVPANAAGQAGQGTITLFNDTYSAILLELESLRAQVVAMQAVVDAARQAVGGSMGGYVALREALRALDKAQATQPESERG